ncbi:hypothetical protein LCGC14_2788250, partial [marine sediment metagenome]
IYINYDGGDGDSFLYFYENSSATGAWVMFDDSEDAFNFNHPVMINGAVKRSPGLTSKFNTATVLSASEVAVGTHSQISLVNLSTADGMGVMLDTLIGSAGTVGGALVHRRVSANNGQWELWNENSNTKELQFTLEPDGTLALTNKITGVTDPDDAQDVATKNYVDGVVASSISKTLAFYPNWRNANNWVFVNTDEYLRNTTIGVSTQTVYVYIDMPKDAATFTVNGSMTLTSTGVVTMTVAGEIEKRLTTGSWTGVAGSISTQRAHGGGGGDNTDTIAWDQAFTVGWEVGAQYRLKITRDLTTTVNVSVSSVNIYGATIQS